MKKALGYIRVSTETQVKDGYGLETQKTAIKRYCQTNGIELIKILADEGISGASEYDAEPLSKRQGMVQLLTEINKDITIVVLNTNRLWRHEQDKVFIKRELIRNKSDIISIEQPRYNVYSKDPSENLYNGMMELLDEFERLNIAMKLAKGRTTKALKGDKPAGSTPFGYEYSRDKKSIVIEEKEAEIIKTIFKMAAAGSSLQTIVDFLNTENILTRRGCNWSKPGLSVILHNKFYIGTVSHQGKEIPGNHSPIINKTQFRKAQGQLAKKYKHNLKTTNTQ